VNDCLVITGLWILGMALLLTSESIGPIFWKENKVAETQFKRGARRSSMQAILSAPVHRAVVAPAPQVARVPAKLDMWGNDQYGDCVTAEEAFKLACEQPEAFIDPQTVIMWAKTHGFLDGADLSSVLDAMLHDGFKVGGQQYNDGGKATVNYADESALKAALTEGPVKIAIDADALPKDAGNKQGWYATGKGRFPNTDHCVGLSGYGPAEWLYQQLNVPLPPALAGKKGYLLFTWSTIGFVDHDWLMGTCVEAWVRSPNTVGVPPLGPPPPPPPPPPGPGPAPGSLGTLTLTSALQPGTYPLGGSGISLSDADVAALSAADQVMRRLIDHPQFHRPAAPGLDVLAILLQILGPVVQQLLAQYGPKLQAAVTAGITAIIPLLGHGKPQDILKAFWDAFSATLKG
jgi:hypothetical protein